MTKVVQWIDVPANTASGEGFLVSFVVKTQFRQCAGNSVTLSNHLLQHTQLYNSTNFNISFVNYTSRNTAKHHLTENLTSFLLVLVKTSYRWSILEPIGAYNSYSWYHTCVHSFLLFSWRVCFTIAPQVHYTLSWVNCNLFKISYVSEIYTQKFPWLL